MSDAEYCVPSELKVGILVGGFGSRLQEETDVRPKPMVEIGGRPILWHVMKIFYAYGFREFLLALGYKGEVIKDFFLSYRHRSRDLTIDMRSGEVTSGNGNCEEWCVNLLDTGLDTMTGGRIRRLLRHVGGEPIILTYGDGVADVDIKKLLAFHRRHGRLATITAVRPPARFGGLNLDGDLVSSFEEKPQIGEGWINGGFFVLEPGVVKYIEGDETVFEREPLENLARDGQLAAFRHSGFWQCMDTLRDVRLLDGLWASGEPPWKIW